MRKAIGFTKWPEFAHKAKHRATGGGGDQGLVTSESYFNRHHGHNRITLARAEEIQWPGLIGVQVAAGYYDPRPRLRKRVGR